MDCWLYWWCQVNQGNRSGNGTGKMKGPLPQYAPRNWQDPRSAAWHSPVNACSPHSSRPGSSPRSRPASCPLLPSDTGCWGAANDTPASRNGSATVCCSCMHLDAPRCIKVHSHVYCCSVCGWQKMSAIRHTPPPTPPNTLCFRHRNGLKTSLIAKKICNS